ncbi:hypothetical protein ROHU_000719 [Labeo rohita]|uniref:Uncharacterized protein n=1 Tax=Labeo rohita TaxID=84645 RepID=A0A498NRJ9_LABRO|nr:hypothetical protein ROHU_004020 [Labeo rohita]RXN34407.1 hypothetical protein ROHU_004021 [Labeo rohita]RXN34408.1 hypothetical protein ROHU_004022 [Labeo rohita]RXN38887.1 hypothetical protein ROHU_000719 [Labeo rohita]
MRVFKCMTQAFEFPYGLAVRIPGFHPGGPGSTPGMGRGLLFASLFERPACRLASEAIFGQQSSYRILIGRGCAPMPPPLPSIALLVARRTVGGALAIFRSLVRRRLFFTRPPFLVGRPSQSGKRAFPDRESNPGRGGESAES